MKSILRIIGSLLLSTFLLFVSCNENSLDKNENKSKKIVVLNSKEKITDVCLVSRFPNGTDPIYGTQNLVPYSSIYYWTFSGITHEAQMCFKFDLSDIPQGKKIKSAVLTLHGIPDTEEGNAFPDTEAVTFYKITNEFSPNQVSWNNPPTYSTSDTIQCPASAYISTYDIKKFIQNWIDYPSLNYGMLLMLSDRSLYHGFDFYTSEATIAINRPKLVIYYE